MEMLLIPPMTMIKDKTVITAPVIQLGTVKVELIELAMELACVMMGLWNRGLFAGGFSPWSIVLVRNTGGLALLAAIFGIRDRSVFRIKREHLKYFFGTGVGSVLLFTVCYFSCQKICSLAVASVLLYTAPSIVVILSAVLWREPITKKKLLALGLTLVGCACVCGVFAGNLSVTPAGILLGLGAGFFYALYSIIGRYALRAGYSAQTMTMAAGVRVGQIISATGSGGTTAGLLLGARLFQPSAKVIGVAVSDDPFDRIVSELAAGAAELLDCASAGNPGDFEMVENVGAGYAVPNAQDTPQILALARDEGILLDPVYTGKAYSKLCRMLEEGSLPGDGAVVFVHTGGAAALFAMDLG